MPPTTSDPPSSRLATLAAQNPGCLAPTTLRDYSRLAQRCEEWASAQALDPWLPETWSAFVRSLQVSVQTALQYVKMGSAILAFASRSPLQLASRSFRAQGALVPFRQAPPLRRAQLDHPSLLPHRLALLLAWKAAARWDEVQRLRLPESFVRIAVDEVIIDWGQATKATRLDPFRASRFAVLVGPSVDEIFVLLSALPPGPVTSLPTGMLTSLLRAVFPAERPSAHSLKSGALDVLAGAAARGEITLAELSLLAKHKTGAEACPTTLRYVRDTVTLARALGTQKLTALL